MGPLTPHTSVPPPFGSVEGDTLDSLGERGWGSPNSDVGTYAVVLFIYTYFVAWTLQGGGTLRVRGWGSPNSDDWRKILALCLLCGPGLLLDLFSLL